MLLLDLKNWLICEKNSLEFAFGGANESISVLGLEYKKGLWHITYLILGWNIEVFYFIF